MRSKLTYANVVSTLCLFLLLGGGAAIAANALPKNSVGTKQIKNGAVTGKKVAANSLTGANLQLSTLGTVPSASTATSAENASHATVADSATTAQHAVTAESAKMANVTHADTADVAESVEELANYEVGCPTGTTLLNGTCFDNEPRGPVGAVKSAADGCASDGGYLPAPLELYAGRNVLNLGSGVGKNKRFTDEYYANTSGSNYKTLVIDGTGTITEFPIEGQEAEYICAYSLVR